MNFDEAIDAYIDKFKEGPPVMGMEEDEAIRKIQEAIDSNKPIEDGAEANLPPGVII